MDPVHGIYGLSYHHEEGDEHRHDGVTDIHDGGDEWHIHDGLTGVPTWRREKTLGVMTPEAQEFFRWDA